MAPSIATVTFFVGDHRTAAVFLRKRVEDIVRMNPWLLGSLESRKGVDDARPVLVYSEKCEGVSADVLEHLAPGAYRLTRNTPYPRVSREVLKLLVKKGAQTVGRREERQFRVCVVPDAASPDTRWALVVSLSHVLADGHTFYKLHNMLSEKASVVALNPTRKFSLPESARAAMGGESEAGFLQRPKPGLLLNLVAGTVTGKFLGPKCDVGVYEVDPEFVARVKKTVQEEGEEFFVSTNDIITSIVLRASGADVGTMDVNFRGRLPGCEDDDAGNYEDKIAYRPADFASPSLIRRSILDPTMLMRASQPLTTLPMTVRDFWRCRMITCVSNWCTFARDVHLHETCGSLPEIHLPIFDPDEVPARVFTGCFVFRAGPGSTCVALAGQKRAIDAVVKSGLVRARHDVATL